MSMTLAGDVSLAPFLPSRSQQGLYHLLHWSLDEYGWFFGEITLHLAYHIPLGTS